MSKVVFRRGILISNYHVILKVEQVGLSYHLTADSHELLDTYYGRVYRKTVVELINNYNKSISQRNNKKMVRFHIDS